MKIGERIADLRKDLGLKQKQVAVKLNVAVSTILNYETDAHEPDLERLCDMADLYGVSIDYICTTKKLLCCMGSKRRMDLLRHLEKNSAYRLQCIVKVYLKILMLENENMQFFIRTSHPTRKNL